MDDRLGNQPNRLGHHLSPRRTTFWGSIQNPSHQHIAEAQERSCGSEPPYLQEAPSASLKNHPLSARAIPSRRLAERTWRGEMLSACRRENNVERLMPNRAAAPFGPATLPLHSRKTRNISSRSSCAVAVVSCVAMTPIKSAALPRSGRVSCRTGPWLR